jgi:hypothetical protein
MAIGDATERERVANLQDLRDVKAKKNLISDYHIGERCAAEYWIVLH